MALRIGDLTAVTVLVGTMEMELSLTGSSGSRKITVANFFTAIPVAVTLASSLTVAGDTVLGTHNGLKFLNIERYDNSNPYAIIRAGASDQNVAVGFQIQTRNAAGTLENWITVDGTTRMATITDELTFSVAKGVYFRDVRLYSEDMGGGEDLFHIDIGATNIMLATKNGGAAVSFLNGAFLFLPTLFNLGSAGLQLGKAASASVATPSTHKIEIKDSTGTTYYVLATT